MISFAVGIKDSSHRCQASFKAFWKVGSDVGGRGPKKVGRLYWWEVVDRPTEQTSVRGGINANQRFL